jgi:3-carboxy-cis,cis-muconate cycloisomerase
MSDLQSGVYGVRAQPDDRAFVQGLLDVELALSWALVHCGLAPEAAASELAPACDASTFDLDALARSTAEKGTPVPGLLSALRERVGDTAAAHLHRGATSQDIVDTAIMLLARRALVPIIDELARAGDACADVAERHRQTLIVGRTLLQQALPLTFGLKAAQWLSGIDGARAELIEVRERVLAVQLGGAVGTLAALGDRGLDVAGDVASQLGLAAPDLPWHTIRLRPARLATALGTALGVMAKIARDLALLAQTEVAEASEGGGAGRGGSSTMPHKRNPVGAVTVLACAQRGPGLVATILSAMPQEHERAAGGWQSEWATLAELMSLSTGAATALSELLGGLEVDPERMRANLDALGGLVMTESVATALGERFGRSTAQHIVAGASIRSVAEGRPLRDVLLEDGAIADALGPAGLDRALDPEAYLGVTGELIDRALAAHRRDLDIARVKSAPPRPRRGPGDERPAAQHPVDGDPANGDPATGDGAER